MHQQYLNIIKSENTPKAYPNNIVFVERCPKSSLVFVENGFREGFIDFEEKRLIMNMYSVLKWEPDLHFYINTNPQTCFERMKMRNRKCEQNITNEYLEMLQNEYYKHITTNTVILNNNPLQMIIDHISVLK
jgi:thymidylate kinase